MMTDDYFLISLHLSHFSSTQHQALRESLRYERSDGVSFPQGNENMTQTQYVYLLCPGASCLSADIR